MNIKEYIISRKNRILDDWFESVLSGYPGEAGKFLRRKDKQFTNPIGYTVFNECSVLLDQITQSFDEGKAGNSLENILKIRAVQDIAPSRSIAFLFGLKKVLQDSLEHDRDPEASAGLPGIFDQIDNLAGMAFDIYMKSRETLWEIRANEIRNRTFRMIDRISQKYHIDHGDETELNDN